MKDTTRVITLRQRPKGKPEESDFEFKEEEVPKLTSNQLLLQSIYISVDPYLRGRMREVKSYVEPFKLDEPISSPSIAKVIESNHDKFQKGDFVFGDLAWKEIQPSDGKGLRKINKDLAPLSTFLGVLGMTGLTAYFGLEKIGKLKKNETLLVSGAAGAVGSVVGQIGKLKGCRVVGIAGSDDKIKALKDNFNFDDGINYKTTENIQKAIAETCPNGVDVYWDNVGGKISDAVFFHINKFARIINCGAIAVYNDNDVPKGVSPQIFLIKNSALMQGFIISNYEDEFSGGVQQLGDWLQEGKLIHKETIVEGFDQLPQAFIDLFDGENTGKMLVKVGEE